MLKQLKVVTIEKKKTYKAHTCEGKILHLPMCELKKVNKHQPWGEICSEVMELKNIEKCEKLTKFGRLAV